jgi:phosphoglycerate dehydrogenase-like enzyme
MQQLRWVQSLAAGPDAVLAAAFRDEVTITTGSGLHDAPVAEHALALLLCLVRRLPQAASAQKEHRWADELSGVQPLHPPGLITTLLRSRILIWGFGNIGSALARICEQMGADIRGLARTPGTRSGFAVAGEDGIDENLRWADAVVMLLPSAPETEHALDARRISLLRPGAYVVNVGRGSTVDERALAQALKAGHIAGAALDVTSTEPLPHDSSLWDVPNVVITPHAAGGRPVGAEELIIRNLNRYISGKPLINQVSRPRGAAT